MVVAAAHTTVMMIQAEELQFHLLSIYGKASLTQMKAIPFAFGDGRNQVGLPILFC